MRLKALFLVSAIAASAMPAFAQDYGRCQQAQSSNQVGGLILGGIIGGVLGSQVAGSGHRSDGSAVGAVLGGLVGSGVGKDSVNCGPPVRYAPGSSYNPNPNYGGPAYNDYGYSPYGSSGSPYSPAPTAVYPPSSGYSPPRYGDDGWYPTDRVSQRGRADDGFYSTDRRPQRGRDDDLYGNPDRDIRRSGDYADEVCDEAVQVTKLPDGSEVRRPVQVCRDSNLGDWKIRD